jgi:hypothetical protein
MKCHLNKLGGHGFVQLPCAAHAFKQRNHLEKSLHT